MTIYLTLKITLKVALTIALTTPKVLVNNEIVYYQVYFIDF